MDPKGDKAFSTTAFENWKRFTKARNMSQVEWSIYEQSPNIAIQKPKDLWNCGVIVSQYIRRILDGNLD